MVFVLTFLGGSDKSSLKTLTFSCGIGSLDEVLFTSLLEGTALQGQGALLPPMQGALPMIKACGLAWFGGEGGCILAAYPHCMAGTPLCFLYFLLVLFTEIHLKMPWDFPYSSYQAFGQERNGSDHEAPLPEPHSHI